MKALRLGILIVFCMLGGRMGSAQEDMGAKVSAQFAALPLTGGTVRIPAGSYSFATTIKLVGGGEHLQCDAGAELHYTGSGDAIVVESRKGGPYVGIDGEGGCKLLGNDSAQSGIRLLHGNTFVIRGMRIVGFKHGNGISLDGANSVQILSNAIIGNQHGIDMVTVPHFAPNAIHVADNEIFNNDWAVYSHNGHAPATRALGNVYRDNVFEGNHVGDLYLAWDAHTVVEGNYFESTGAGVAAGTGGDKVYDIQVVRNYFTVAGAPGYRSEIELGYVLGAVIEANYEEGVGGAGTGCAVNVLAGRAGSASNVVLRNSFSRLSEGKMSQHELCYQGKPEIPPGVLGQTRLAGGLAVDGGVKVSGPLELEQGAVGSTASVIKAGEACTTEGMLLISRPANQTARLYFCSGFKWQPVAPPH